MSTSVLPARKVVLLTFERLPPLFGPWTAEYASFHDLYDRLSDGMTVADYYYAQSAGARELASVLPGCVVGVPSTEMAYVMVTQTPNDRAPECVADGVRVLRATVDNIGAQVASLSDSASLIWMHCTAEVKPDSFDVIERMVGAAEDCRAGCDGVLVVTSLHGWTPPPETELSSLLWESEIRVPFWIRIPDQDPCRVSGVVGSDSLPLILRHCLIGSTDFWPHVTLSTEQSTASATDRFFIFRRSACRAVRTPEFLFVIRTDAEGTQTDCDGAADALYVKPDDIWNVTDVSVEYLAVAEKMHQLLRQTSGSDHPCD